jgi:hypothetical protein
MSDIYSAPTAALNTVTEGAEYGSLERGIAGNYQFSVGETLSEAWAKTNGAKWKVHLALGLYLLVYIPVAMLSSFLLIGDSSPTAAIGGTILQFVVLMAVVTPLMAGLLMLGVKRAVGAPLAATSIFSYYGKIVPLLITSILSTVLILVGFLLLIIPGIYLSIAYYLAVPLVVEKNLSPWEAMEASRKAIGKRWFAVFGMMIVITLINFVGMIPLGIGLIWTVPMSLIAMGILYRNVFGCSAETQAG